MSYQPYLIADFSTGVDVRLQPWLSPDDSQQELLDGFVYRGVMSKREGYNYFATGQRGGSAYRESRIVHALTAVAMVGAINGVNTTFTLAGTAQIARGSVIVTGSNPVQVLVDNGSGGFTGPGTGTINYTTGAISVTFTLPPAIASTITVNYSFMPGDPVMMIASFYTATNIRQLIVADTTVVNRYNSTLNILEYLTATPFTGNSHQFFSWVNYESATTTPRLLFSNNKDPIQVYDGATVANYALQYDGVVGPTTIVALLLFNLKDRLILLRTTEAGGTVFPRRIRISGTGANSDDFRTSATGAGFIDIPDNTWIMGATINRDDLLIFTEASTWVLKYTGNDTTPFVLNRIDESRGSQAPYAAITYLNRSSAASPRGLIMSDGYRVERQDVAIPNFSFNDINQKNFDMCFAGTVDEDRDHYLIYPEPGQNHSTRILVTNYDEDNYSTYRLPLSCMGRYVLAFDVTWNDLTTMFDNWDEFAAAYGNWNSFAFSQGAPFSIGGGHHGEIWKLNATESEDNPVKIRNITVIDPTTIEVTTDWNNFSDNLDKINLPADMIFITGVSGMLEINNKQNPILAPFINNNTFRLKVNSTAGFSAFTTTSIGTASRVIPFTSLMKKFNPYVAEDKKVRCGWLYMYVDAADTSLTRNIAILGAANNNPAIISTSVNHGLHTGDQVSFFGIGGMTQLNDTTAVITVLTPSTFSLNGINAIPYGIYTSGGYATVSEPAKLDINIIVNDVDENTQLNNPSLNPYQGNCTNLVFEEGYKKWYKVFINQTGRFIQFRLNNTQAGATINIQAFMPGFAPVGRLL